MQEQFKPSYILKTEYPSHEVDDVEKFTLTDAITTDMEDWDPQPFKRNLDISFATFTTKTTPRPELNLNKKISAFLSIFLFILVIIFLDYLFAYISNITFQREATEDAGDTEYIVNKIDQFTQEITKLF